MACLRSEIGTQIALQDKCILSVALNFCFFFFFFKSALKSFPMRLGDPHFANLLPFGMEIALWAWFALRASKKGRRESRTKMGRRGRSTRLTKPN